VKTIFPLGEVICEEVGTASVVTGAEKPNSEVCVAGTGKSGFPFRGVEAASVASRSEVGTGTAEGALQARIRNIADSGTMERLSKNTSIAFHEQP
jgi:hypothetical protein